MRSHKKNLKKTRNQMKMTTMMMTMMIKMMPRAGINPATSLGAQVEAVKVMTLRLLRKRKIERRIKVN